jgi:hypothetical protein
MLGDERALFIMTVFRRTVIDAVGGFDPALFTNEEYEMWIRAALAGFTFARHPKPLGWYSCRPDSLSSSDTRMLSGILRVFAKTRPSLPEGSAERAILDRQVARFEMELLAADARNSLIAGNARKAARHLTALHARRGGWKLWLAASAATVAPGVALAAYRLQSRAKALRYGRSPDTPRRPFDIARIAVRTARRIDQAIGHVVGRRRVLVDVRNPMHAAVLEPITEALERDPRIAVHYTAERPAAVAAVLALKRPGRVVTHSQAAWRRWDLYVSADPWTRPALRRCARYANVFHGVAGKYDLDPETCGLKDVSTGKVPDFYFGYPFPKIDKGDPLAACKMAWNFTAANQMGNGQGATFTLSGIDGSGLLGPDHEIELT